MKKRYKIPLIFTCIVSFLVITIYLLITQTKLLETQVARYLSNLIDKDTPVQIKIGKIRGYIWGEVIVENLQLEYVEKGFEYTLLKLDKLSLSFNPLDLLQKKWSFSLVEFYHPTIQIKQASDGRFLVPALKKKKRTTGAVSNLSFPFILFKDGSFDLVSLQKSFTLDSINFALSLNKNREGINLNLLNGSLLAKTKEILRLKKISIKSKIKTGEVYLEKLKLETTDSRIEFKDGIFTLKPFSFSINLKGDPFYLTDIKRVSGVDLKGKLKLEGDLKGNHKRVKGDLVLNGDLFGKELSGLKTNFLYERKRFTFYSLRGKAFRAPVQLAGELNIGEKPESYLLKGKVESLDLANIVSTSLHSDLSGNLDMKGKGLNEKDLQLNFSLELEPGRFDRYSFSKASGTLSVTTEDVKFDKDFHLWYKNTEVTGEGRIGFYDTLNLTGRAIFNDLRDFRNQTFVKEIEGRGRFDFIAYGPFSDFALEGRFESDSIWGYKLFCSDLKADLKIKKFISRKGGVIQLLLWKGNAWGIPYDSLSSQILLEGDSVRIDSTRMFNNSLSLIFFGNLDISRYPQNLTFEKISLDYRGNKIESAIPARIEIDTLEVRFIENNFRMNGGSFSLSGRMDYYERMNLKFDLKNMQVLSWERLSFPTRKIDGKLNATVELKGDFKNPEINLYTEIRDINYEGVDLGFLSGSMSYKDKKLFLDKVSLMHLDGNYSLSGIIPINLSFYPVSDRFLDQSQNLVFKGEGNRFSLICLFIPDLEYLQGLFKGEVIITGTPLHPKLEGDLELSQGTLKLVHIQNPITQVRGKLRMENENLYIEEVRGFALQEKITNDNLLKKFWHIIFPEEKIKGELFLYGNINLGDIRRFKYELTLVGRDLPLSYEYADLVSTVDFNLEISGVSPPLVSGEILFSHLAFRDPFNSLMQATAGPPIPQENLWDLELNLSGDNNFWVLNQDMQAEFKGEVLLSRKSGDLKLLGDLETIRGKYFIYGTTFKIEKGSFVFDNIQKIDPKLDFLVSSSLNGSTYSVKDSMAQTGQEVELAIVGTLSAPEIKPASGSPYSKEQIAELLAFHQRFSTGESGGGSLFQYKLAGSLGEAYANRFLENLATRSIGVETFEIKPLEPGKFSLWESEVTVGKYISNKVYLRYTRRLTESTGQEGGLEYRLSKRFYLEGNRDKQGLFHLGLNLYWEY
jgi:autotransporter translocation and assembly factor TamB